MSPAVCVFVRDEYKWVTLPMSWLVSRSTFPFDRVSKLCVLGQA